LYLHKDALITIIILFLLSIAGNAYQYTKIHDLSQKYIDAQGKLMTLGLSNAFMKAKLEHLEKTGASKKPSLK
jgi:hypothetical protein